MVHSPRHRVLPTAQACRRFPSRRSRVFGNRWLPPLNQGPIVPATPAAQGGRSPIRGDEVCLDVAYSVAWVAVDENGYLLVKPASPSSLRPARPEAPCARLLRVA